MGPYYRSTSQGVGAGFDFLYQYPILMIGFMAGVVAVGAFFWLKNRRK